MFDKWDYEKKVMKRKIDVLEELPEREALKKKRLYDYFFDVCSSEDSNA